LGAVLLALGCGVVVLGLQGGKVALGAAVQATGRPPVLGAPGEPGPFSLADQDRIVRLLKSAGFTDLRLDALVRPARLRPSTGIKRRARRPSSG
jgi:hypothetical protein